MEIIQQFFMGLVVGLFTCMIISSIMMLIVALYGGK
jgi:hypothetical protein